MTMFKHTLMNTYEMSNIQCVRRCHRTAGCAAVLYKETSNIVLFDRVFRYYAVSYTDNFKVLLRQLVTTKSI